MRWRFDPSGGPGGQHANRSNTRVEATLDLLAIEVPDDVAARLKSSFGAEVRVVVDETRSQTRNRDIALDRMEDRLAVALTVKPSRRKTRPSRSARKRRVDSKRKRGDLKRSRRRPTAED